METMDLHENRYPVLTPYSLVVLGKERLIDKSLVLVSCLCVTVNKYLDGKFDFLRLKDFILGGIWVLGFNIQPVSINNEVTNNWSSKNEGSAY